MSNSPLVDYTRLSPNCSRPRKAKIDRITIHHMSGNLSVETCGAVFANSARQASSNYGIGSDGRIGLYVDEANRAWTSSSSANDNRAVTIEVANSKAAYPWPVSDAAYESLIALCADICRRNDIPRLNYTGDTSGNLTMHCWFAATDCPGAYLKERFPAIAEEVNRRLGTDYGAATDYFGMVTASRLNCRESPVSGKVITTYPGGATVYISREKDGWGLTADGWVSLNYIKKIEEDEDMFDVSKLTMEECYEIVQKAQTYAGNLPVSGWATEKLQKAAWDGITDGTRPRALVTREEAAIMADRAKGGQ